MKQISKFFVSLLIIFFLFLPNVSVAGPGGGGSGKNMYIDISFFPDYVFRNDTGSIDNTGGPAVATESGTGYDIRTTLGYVFWDQILVGLTYNTHTLSTKRDAIAGGDSGLDETTVRTEYGPVLGYVGNNWRILGTLFTYGNKQRDTKNFDETGTPTGDVTIKNSNGSGYQLSVGYIFDVSGSFQIGPSLVYRNLKYTKQTKENRLNNVENYTDVELTSPSVEATLIPMVSLIFRF